MYSCHYLIKITLLFGKNIIDIVGGLFWKLGRYEYFEETFIDERVLLSLSKVRVEYADFLKTPFRLVMSRYSFGAREDIHRLVYGNRFACHFWVGQFLLNLGLLLSGPDGYCLNWWMS